MCVAAPGIVKEVNGSKVMVDFNGNLIECESGLINTSVGDSVLVHAGCVIQVLSDFDRDMLLDIIDEIESL